MTSRPDLALWRAVSDHGSPTVASLLRDTSRSATAALSLTEKAARISGFAQQLENESFSVMAGLTRPSTSLVRRRAFAPSPYKYAAWRAVSRTMLGIARRTMKVRLWPQSFETHRLRDTPWG